MADVLLVTASYHIPRAHSGGIRDGITRIKDSKVLDKHQVDSIA